MFKFRTNNLGNGASETGVYSSADNSLVAVITHPCAGAKWFIHRMGSYAKESAPTKKEAIKRISENKA